MQIPTSYKYSTILVASNNVTNAMYKFGEVLRRVYSKSLDYKRTDFSLNYLGWDIGKQIAKSAYFDKLIS